MILLTLTDLHGDIQFLSEIQQDLIEADLVIISGDITNFGYREEAGHIINSIALYNKNIVAIPGNCDYPDVNVYLTELNYSIDCRSKVIGDFFIMGLGGSLPCPGRTPNEYSEDEMSLLLEQTVADNTDSLPIVLVVHQPPFNTLNDSLSDGFHVGSHSVRQFIEKYQPVLCFCGHIHEAIAKDTIGKTKVLNPGPFGMGRYAKTILEKDNIKAELQHIFAT